MQLRDKRTPSSINVKAFTGLHIDNLQKTGKLKKLLLLYSPQCMVWVNWVVSTLLALEAGRHITTFGILIHTRHVSTSTIISNPYLLRAPLHIHHLTQPPSSTPAMQLHRYLGSRHRVAQLHVPQNPRTPTPTGTINPAAASSSSKPSGQVLRLTSKGHTLHKLLILHTRCRGRWCRTRPSLTRPTSGD